METLGLSEAAVDEGLGSSLDLPLIVVNGKNYVSGAPFVRTSYDVTPLFANFYPNTGSLQANLEPPTKSRISVIYFTGAGGNPMGPSEVRFAKELTDSGNIDVHIVRLPGRYDRSDDNAYGDVSFAIRDISNAILSAHDTTDTLIFAGRSFGVDLGMQVAYTIEDSGIKIDSFHMITPSGPAFWNDELAVKKWRSAVSEKMGNLNLFDVPAIHADGITAKMMHELDDDRRSTSDKSIKLNTRILHYVGTDDECSKLKYFNLSDISDNFQRYAFPGDHFFIDELSSNIVLPRLLESKVV
jgi:surfactin synthase thioesterase subunit